MDEVKCISGLFANLFRTETSAVDQRELDTRFIFEGEPVGLVAQLLQNQSFPQLVLDPFWVLGPSLTGTTISVATESLSFRAPACNTEDELRQLLTRLYVLTALLEQEMTKAPQTN